MCDIFERHRLAEVNHMMDRSRARLFAEIIPVCTSLAFLFLTKRPHDILRLVPRTWRPRWPPNVWIGCTVEDQQRAVQRLPHLLEIPAPVRFVSAEPLLGPLDLSPWLNRIDWVILGGESGPKSRPMSLEWAQGVRDQCVNAGVPLHFKQWGEFSDGLVRLGKKRSGGELDGRTWDELPTPRACHRHE
jgi:protein gp37